MEKELKLNNGVNIPRLGFGTASIISWRNESPEVTKVILNALEVGYRHIDTASVYNTEKNIGEAIKESGIKREELFITTKVWNTDQGYDPSIAINTFEKSLKKLNTDYVDLLLIHWPITSKMVITYKALEQLYNEKKVKAIGVSNFTIKHLNTLMENTNIVPAVNQIELHPYFNQTEIRKFHKEHNIITESWSPLGSGNWNTKVKIEQKPITNDIIKGIASKHNKTTAQVIIRWHLQHDLVVVPKSENKERMIQNLDVYNFELQKEDMDLIDKLDKQERFGGDPDTYGKTFE